MANTRRLTAQVTKQFLDVEVLSIPAGTFPKNIIVRALSSDGPAQYARWSGFPALSVGDVMTARRDPNDFDTLVIEGSYDNNLDDIYLRLDGTFPTTGAIKLIQSDGNEYITSLADGYVDIGATTAIRLNGNVEITGALTTSGGRIVNTTRVTTTYAILVTDNVIFANTDGSAWTATLPVGVEGQHLKIINCGSSGNDLTVDPNGTEELYGGGAGVSSTLSDGEVINIHYNATEGWW